MENKVQELKTTLRQHVQQGAALAVKLVFAAGSEAAVGAERARKEEEEEEEEEALPGGKRSGFLTFILKTNLHLLAPGFF